MNETARERSGGLPAAPVRIGLDDSAARALPCVGAPAMFRAPSGGSCRGMAMNFLDFEQPIAELEAKIDEFKFVSNDAEVNIGEEIARLKAKSRALTTSIFSNLTQWQIAQLARHPQRPYTLDYISAVFTDFQELHGDRMYADDHAIVGGAAGSKASQ